MVKKNGFALIAFALLVTVFSVACRKTSAPNQATAGMANSGPALAPAKFVAKSENLPLIVAFGDSLTAGFGLPEEQWLTTLLQRRLDEKGYRYRMVNAGMAGDTSAGGVRRLDWALEGDVKYLILELGGNDGLRGLPVADMKKNLAGMIERAQARSITVILAGMEAPPNLGEEYTSEFRQVFRDLAKKYKLTLIPFLLEGIAGHPGMNQPDGIHPNANGAKAMTENVWRELEPLLAK